MGTANIGRLLSGNPGWADFAKDREEEKRFGGGEGGWFGGGVEDGWKSAMETFSALARDECTDGRH